MTRDQQQVALIAVYLAGELSPVKFAAFLHRLNMGLEYHEPAFPVLVPEDVRRPPRRDKRFKPADLGQARSGAIIRGLHGTHDTATIYR